MNKKSLTWKKIEWEFPFNKIMGGLLITLMMILFIFSLNTTLMFKNLSSQSILDNNVIKTNPRTSQSNIITWNRTWGGLKYDAGYDIWGDGTNYYTTGYTDSFSAEERDLLIIKWDTNGNQIWNRTWGDKYAASGKSIWGEGTNIYTAGYTINFSGGNEDLLIIKWDSNGTVIWNRTWGGIGSELCDSIWGNGAFLYTSGFSENLLETVHDQHLIKWDTDGNIIWNKSKAVYGSSMEFYNLESSIWGNTTNLYTSSYVGENQYELIRWDPNGNILWKKTWKNSSSDDGTSIWGNDINIFTVSPGLMAKWDSNGNSIWNRTSNVGSAPFSIWGDGFYLYTTSTKRISYYNRDLTLFKRGIDGDLAWTLPLAEGLADVSGYSIWGNGTSLFILGSTRISKASNDISLLLIKCNSNLMPVSTFSVSSDDLEVVFTFTGSKGEDPLKYYWQFGDNSTNSSDSNPTHEYENAGNYTVILTIVDRDGDASSSQQEINITGISRAIKDRANSHLMRLIISFFIVIIAWNIHPYKKKSPTDKKDSMTDNIDTEIANFTYTDAFVKGLIKSYLFAISIRIILFLSKVPESDFFNQYFSLWAYIVYPNPDTLEFLYALGAIIALLSMMITPCFKNRSKKNYNTWEDLSLEGILCLVIMCISVLVFLFFMAYDFYGIPYWSLILDNIQFFVILFLSSKIKLKSSKKKGIQKEKEDEIDKKEQKNRKMSDIKEIKKLISEFDEDQQYLQIRKVRTLLKMKDLWDLEEYPSLITKLNGLIHDESLSLNDKTPIILLFIQNNYRDIEKILDSAFYTKLVQEALLGRINFEKDFFEIFQSFSEILSYLSMGQLKFECDRKTSEDIKREFAKELQIAYQKGGEIEWELKLRDLLKINNPKPNLDLIFLEVMKKNLKKLSNTKSGIAINLIHELKMLLEKTPTIEVFLDALSNISRETVSTELIKEYIAEILVSLGNPKYNPTLYAKQEEWRKITKGQGTIDIVDFNDDQTSICPQCGNRIALFIEFCPTCKMVFDWNDEEKKVEEINSVENPNSIMPIDFFKQKETEFILENAQMIGNILGPGVNLSDENRQIILDIGEKSNRIGGFDLMTKVAKKVKKMNDQVSSTLDSLWDGIGDWGDWADMDEFGDIEDFENQEKKADMIRESENHQDEKIGKRTRELARIIGVGLGLNSNIIERIREIGRELNQIGGMELMMKVSMDSSRLNPRVSGVLGQKWDGIGDWVD
jgi:PKD repeat protein